MRLLCPCCHGENISRDAVAVWNGEEWELSGVYERMTCDDCGKEFDEAEESK